MKRYQGKYDGDCQQGRVGGEKRNGCSRTTRVEIPIFMQGLHSQSLWPTDPKTVFHIPGLLNREVCSADQLILYPPATDVSPPLPVGWDGLLTEPSYRGGGERGPAPGIFSFKPVFCNYPAASCARRRWDNKQGVEDQGQ